jgi:hypothetical protein
MVERDNARRAKLFSRQQQAHSLANLLAPNNLRRGARIEGPKPESLDFEHVFHRLLPILEREVKETTVPLGWEKGHHHSMVHRTSRYLESTALF